MRRRSSQRWGKKRLRFAPTELISSTVLLCSRKISARDSTTNGRQMTMLHRESNRQKVARNLDAVFDLHGAALGGWKSTPPLTTFQN